MSTAKVIITDKFLNMQDALDFYENEMLYFLSLGDYIYITESKVSYTNGFFVVSILAETSQKELELEGEDSE